LTTKAVILTGGRGTRLAPFTTVLPKPLMPIGDIPILEIILRQLAAHGIDEIVLAGGYLAELIEAYLSSSALSRRLKFKFHREQRPLGTAGALSALGPFDDTFLVMNGDILTTLDYTQLIDHHRRSGAALTIAITRKRVQLELGVLLLDEMGNVNGYDEKPVKEFPASMGIYVYEPRVLSHIPSDTYLDFPRLVLRLLEAGERVVGCSTDCFWLDMGNQGELERAVREFETNPHAFIGRSELPGASEGQGGIT
jgi:NDP-sugar pyrophosphorylase family protein